MCYEVIGYPPPTLRFYLPSKPYSSFNLWTYNKAWPPFVECLQMVSWGRYLLQGVKLPMYIISFPLHAISPLVWPTIFGFFTFLASL
eukprot:c28117_g4_i1 orf=262-522(-)